MSRDIFEEAFSDSVGTYMASCACGKTYYNPDSTWSWEDGELERLEADPKAIAIDHAVGYVTFEGVTYINACDCWHERAERIMAFLDEHASEIATYLNEERARRIREAESLCEVKAIG